MKKDNVKPPIGSKWDNTPMNDLVHWESISDEFKGMLKKMWVEENKK